MRKVTQAQLLPACAACFALGWFASQSHNADVQANTVLPKAAEPIPFPMAARMGCNLYLQNSAEYRACCLGIYKNAELRLEMTLAKTPKPAKPAVVMDLDETVFDNSAFQTFLYRNNLEYTDELWADYEENFPQDVTLIPGAKAFIAHAESLGVTVIYMSNRSEVNLKPTEKALELNGFSKPTGRVYLKPKGASSDKSARREAIAAKCNVLMYVGDNLRDFSETFQAAKLPKDATPEDCLKAIQQRAVAADAAACHWGLDWIVLPNPVYGEWEKLIGPDPRALLHPTSMKDKVPGPK